jgi:hypothetical protein
MTLSLFSLLPDADSCGKSLNMAVAMADSASVSGVTVPEVVINEILYRRSSAGQPEFIELYNSMPGAEELGGWRLEADSGVAPIPDGTVIEGGGYLVFTDTAQFAETSDNYIYLPDFPSLDNSGSSVVIRRADGEVADSLKYLPKWGEELPGVSLERLDPAALSIDPANWASSLSATGSTPGIINSRFRIDREAPQIVFAKLTGEGDVELFFDKFVDLISESHLSRFFLNGRETEVLEYDPAHGFRVLLDGSEAVAGQEILLRTEGVRDFKGNGGGGSHPVAQPVKEGSVVINELMYHPLSSGHSVQSEYLELYNRMPHAVSLEGIYLHDEATTDGSPAEIEPVSTEYTWIPAGGYALVYPETDNLALSESRTGRFFDLHQEDNPFGLRVGRSSLGLVNAGRSVYLADSTGATLDWVHYMPEWHNPNVMTTHGRALERIDPDGYSNDGANWGTATAGKGGTPMRANSLLSPDGSVQEGGRITLSPNPFSPYGSLEKSELTIAYQLDDPDSLLRVRIFDRYGRVVRSLADNYPAGRDGYLIWDGRDQSGRIGRIGIYIIYVEAFNGQTGYRQVFRETAVLARQF